MILNNPLRTRRKKGQDQKSRHLLKISLFSFSFSFSSFAFFLYSIILALFSFDLLTSIMMQFDTNDDEVCIPGLSKGQLISECPFGFKTSSIKPTKFLPYFCPSLFLKAWAEIGQKFRWFFGRSFETKRTF